MQNQYYNFSPIIFIFFLAAAFLLLMYPLAFALPLFK